MNIEEQHSSKSLRIENDEQHPMSPRVEVENEGCHLNSNANDAEEINIASLKRDPGQHPQIGQYPLNQCDKIQRAYLKVGSYQIRLSNYLFSRSKKNSYRFQPSWFAQFSS